MLERAYPQYDLNPSVYPYASRYTKAPRQIRTCSIFYPPIRSVAPKAKPHPLQLIVDGYYSAKNKPQPWQTENQVRYKVIDFTRNVAEKDPFIVTTLDTRKHKPQSKQIFHIHRVNKKPVCAVQSWVDEGPRGVDENKGSTIYMSSYKIRQRAEPRATKKPKECIAEGIVPFNQPEDQCDVKTEMMLPVCETTSIPSAPNPHKYLLRRRKVPPVQTECGVFYPDEDKRSQSATPEAAKISVTSLCGQNFTRRKYIRPPAGNISVQDFDGGARAVSSHKFDERYLPFLHVQPII